MLRSLDAVVSGMQAQQQNLDVIGNNISNVNTIGYKRATTTFKDLLSQTESGAAAPNDQTGGTNPIQVGLGVQIGSISQDFSQGSLQATGSNTDLAIAGNGMFVLKGGGSDSIRLSRAGSFSLDASGMLVAPATGYRVQGWMADAAGKITPGANTTSVLVPIGASIPAQATSEVEYGQNLDSRSPSKTGLSVTSYVYDSLGSQHSVEIKLTKTGANAWRWTASSPEKGVSVSGSGSIVFNPTTGRVAAGGFGKIMINPGGGIARGAAVLDFTGTTQFASATSITAQGQNGHASGQLEKFSIDSRGVITGSYSNGKIRAIGQVAMASVANPAGLTKEGNNYYAESPNSGIPLIGEAGVSGRGSIISGSLETANVDLSQEFSALITAQRGFQANARVVTTSDEVLQELLNIKR